MNKFSVGDTVCYGDSSIKYVICQVFKALEDDGDVSYLYRIKFITGVDAYDELYHEKKFRLFKSFYEPKFKLDDNVVETDERELSSENIMRVYAVPTREGDVYSLYRFSGARTYFFEESLKKVEQVWKEVE